MWNQSSRKRSDALFALAVAVLSLSTVAVVGSIIIKQRGIDVNTIFGIGCGCTDDARIAAAKSDIATLSSAVEQYHHDTGQYPSTGEGLTALTARPKDVPDWKGPYLERAIPSDPWGDAYDYQSRGPNGQDYLITSYGADGMPGGMGQNADITSDDN